MSQNILKLDLFRLRMLEVQSLANSVIKIVEKHDPETLKIKEIFDKLVEQEPQIKNLKIGYRKHPITSELNDLRKRRNAFISGFIKRIETIDNGKVGGMEESVKVAKPLVIHYLQGLARKTEIDIAQTIIQFSELVAEDEKLATALSTLNLIPDLDNLRSVNHAIMTKTGTRVEENSRKSKIKTSDRVLDIKIAIGNLFKQIEVAQLKHEELDYNPLIDELNEKIALLIAILRSRSSYYQKKAEEALNNKEVVEEDNEVVIESTSEKPSAATQSTERMYPMNVEVDKEDNLEQLDIKKTVAVSEKQTRLPIVSTEA